MAAHSDVRNYYCILGLSVDASAKEIKRAYRRRAKELHPDRHANAPDATAKFQALNEAHVCLSNPKARARYDAACVTTAEAPDQSHRHVEPVTCCSCGAVSAQPRYVIFWYVIGHIVVTSRRAVQGVFCPSCAPRKALQASATTWLLGWWGFPWGPIWTLGALYRNLFAGTQPADANAQILRRQALYFWDEGNDDLAVAAVDQALQFKIGPELREQLSELRQALSPVRRTRLVDKWRVLRGWGFWAQLVPVLIVLASVAWFTRNDIAMAVAERRLAHVEVRSAVLAEPRSTARAKATVRPFENIHVLAGRGKGAYERVITDHGKVGFLPAASIIVGDGMADLRKRCFPFGPANLTNGMILRHTRTGPHTLKATNGLSLDAVVKLRETSGQTVVSFYVTAGSVVTIDNVPQGVFRIDFATGHEFSPSCGYFLSEMSSRRFVDPESFVTRFEGEYGHESVVEINLDPTGGGTMQQVSADDTIFDRD